MTTRAHMATERATRAALPRLELGGPLRVGLAAIVLFAGGAGAAVRFVHGPPSIALAATLAAAPHAITLRPSKPGVIAHVHVAAGTDVKAGERLITFDTGRLDDQIAALRLQADAAKLKLTGVRQEAQALSQSDERTPTMRQRLQTLERQLADVEKETIGLGVQIALAEQDVLRAEVRAPAAGRITAVHAGKPGSSIAAHASLVEFLPAAEQLHVDARWPAHAAARPPVGTPVRVSLAPADGGRSHAFDGHVVASDTSEPAARDDVRVVLAASRSDVALRLRLDRAVRAEIRLPGRVPAAASQAAAAAASLQQSSGSRS